ncbi:pentapeptide repeat-containing protein [Actinophytocola sp. NPDC049390]|uniref:pentapeptide repeat-containing protein n=1 Tax=Actinophytocola sp. NPDC049390 TaxID=3363894 RepID=UPI003788C928
MRWLSSAFAAVAVSVALVWPAAAVAAPGTCPTITRPLVADEPPAAGRLACADLRGWDLHQDRLAGADLHGSNLAGVSLGQADLAGADLSGANLAGADLSQADLSGANLRGANLADAELVQTDLANADLRDAVLAGANGTQAVMNDADLRGANLRGTYLGQAFLNRADLRDADLTGATTSQAETDGALGLPDRALDGSTPPPADPVTDTDTDTQQVAHTLLWPAGALALAWWRGRVGYLLRHRRTTPTRPGRVVGAVVGVGVVVAGIYLAAVGVLRGFTHLIGGVPWATDPGPLGFLATAPHHQLAFAGGAFLVGGLVSRLSRGRRREAERTPAGSQVAIGKPKPAPVGPELPAPVRLAVKVLACACLADLVAVVAMIFLDALPATGPWRAGTVVGHLVFVAITTLLLFLVTERVRTGEKVATPSGVVFAAGGRDPFVWLSGTSADKRAASQALPWEALDQVHLIRVLGTADPSSAMITVRAPGTDEPAEYPAELPVTRDRVAALRELLPPEMVTEHTRAPSSG